MTGPAVASAEVLAKTGEAAKSGPIGFAVILVLCVACYFLFKSLSRHLKTVREEFPPAEGSGPPAPATPVTPTTPVTPDTPTTTAAADPGATTSPASPAPPASPGAAGSPTGPGAAG